ncbi:hypothetical protein BO86DRAFT_390076 [Aspergillus japonicus CBS 114.51]|uniref:Uncharacterized protein n=1 Tax=Aspergillus japonicus CBS 114.51 TaxID=1448312 RepID=A0A8T8WXT2_ASPJA|nr:hypothetical protein BO86DRAFT_390076 [Aspergillus japonicus CBS 114.51]RAH80697.1 hypothetical protein BO86DRAFT_390076 [Aspergillus japonicus CBS 114.51]
MYRPPLVPVLQTRRVPSPFPPLCCPALCTIQPGLATLVVLFGSNTIGILPLPGKPACRLSHEYDWITRRYWGVCNAQSRAEPQADGFPCSMNGFFFGDIPVLALGRCELPPQFSCLGTEQARGGSNGWLGGPGEWEIWTLDEAGSSSDSSSIGRASSMSGAGRALLTLKS